MGIINEEQPRWDARVPIMGASHYSFARSLSNFLLLLLFLAVAAQVRARPLLAESSRMTIEDYGRSLRPLTLRHSASPPVTRPRKEMPATAATMTTNEDRYDEVVGAKYSPPPPAPKVSPPIHQITCLYCPPSDEDLIISMVTDLDSEAPSKSPPPPPKVSPPLKQVKDDLERPSRSPPPAPKVAPPQKPGTGNFEAPSRSPPPPPQVAPPQKPWTEDFKAPSRSPPPPPKVAPPWKPGTNDFEAPSRSPPPPPKVAPPPRHINNSKRTYKSPPPSQNSSPSTHQLTEEFGRLTMISSERSLPSAESYHSAY